MIEPVLTFWFGKLDAQGRADAAHAALWWKKDPAFDRLIRESFGPLHEEVASGKHDDWLATAPGSLAFIIVLDQFSRNMFRSTAKMFASDARALQAAQLSIERGFDRTAAHDERSFFYMPLMHSEELGIQERCVALFSAWRDSLPGPARSRLDGAVKYAEQHRDIIKRFGRFPHRNTVLGRPSTPEELAFLQQPGSSF